MTATGPALDLSALVRELVRRPTVSGDADAQRDVLGTLTEVLRERAPHLQVTEGRDRDHPWTLLRTPADPGRRQLLLACHVDTVPATDPAAWQRDPFDGDLDGGRVWGRGGSDMKAGVVAAAAALAAADPGTPVSLLLTSDEEIGSQGAAAAAGAVADLPVGAVVVPEATGNQVVLGHKGALWLAVRTAGRAAHGSTPERGHNAVLDLAALLARAGGGLALPPVGPPADDPWVTSLPAPVLPTPATYFTDASVLVQVVRGAPIVVWGPGTPAVMHAVDEYVEIAEVEQAAAAFTDVVSRWNGSPAGSRRES